MRYLRWLFWSLWYCWQPWPSDFDKAVLRAERTRKFWRKFQPCVYHDEDGAYWRIWFSNEPSVAVAEPDCKLPCVAQRSQHTNEIVGLTIYDESLKPQ